MLPERIRFVDDGVASWMVLFSKIDGPVLDLRDADTSRFLFYGLLLCQGVTLERIEAFYRNASLARDERGWMIQGEVEGVYVYRQTAAAIGNEADPEQALVKAVLHVLAPR